MPNDLIPYSQVLEDPQSVASDLETSDVMAIAREDVTKPTGFKSMVTRFLTIAKKIVNGIDYSTELDTEAKTITGAINEVNANSGSTNIIGMASGAIATFNDGGDNIPVKSLVTEITATQAGTGTPSPSNPRPITGFDSVDVVVSGINLWDEEWENCSWNTSGVKTPTVNTIGSKNYIEVKPNTTYYFVFPSTWTRLVVRELDVNKAFVTTSLPSPSNRSITTSSNTRFIVFSTWSDDNITTYSNNISINYPSTETAYHAYTGTTHTIPLPETIYGGTAELVGGNGSKTWEGLTNLANGDWSSQGEGDYQFFAMTVSGVDVTRITELLCNKYRTLTPGLTNTDDNIVGIISSGTVLRIRDKRYNATTINDFKTSLSDCIVIFPKATPTPFTFTGANIPTLSGENNIYSNCGDVEVEYFNENADQIAELIRVMTR